MFESMCFKTGKEVECGGTNHSTGDSEARARCGEFARNDSAMGHSGAGAERSGSLVSRPAGQLRSGQRHSPEPILDIRKIDGPITPKDQFFAVQHLGRSAVDPATYRLKITGMVKQPVEFSIADLRAMRATELTAGFECSGNSARSVQGLSSNGQWTGVRLNTLLKNAGIALGAHEVGVFWLRSRY